MWFLENAWLIPVIPTIGYFVILLLGNRMPLKEVPRSASARWPRRSCSPAAPSSVDQRVDHYSAGHEGALGTLSSFGRSIIPAQAAGPNGGGRPRGRLLRAAGHPSVDVVAGGRLQVHPRHPGRRPVRLVMFVVTLIMLIQLYSIQYGRGDRRFTFFFSALTLFAAGMLCMVVAEGGPFILGWEIMGLSRSS